MDFLKVYAFLVWILFLGIFVAPIAALFHAEAVAGFSYSIYAPLCHQYPGRSFAIFPNTEAISDCTSNIPNESYVWSKYTSFFFVKNYSGPFTYNVSDVGRVRAEICAKNGEIGYKLAVCARDTGFYAGLALATFLIDRRRDRKEKKGKSLGKFPFWLFVLMVVPFAFDGLGQFLGFWQSTNITRLLTGLFAGLATSLLLMDSLREW
ncbi:MAG: DUF2085 domain-containing protein [Methanobacteriota archaeon]|nr:MAG: DUF2085 domain-containing protein [Euryarchaeota archaeon]